MPTEPFGPPDARIWQETQQLLDRRDRPKWASLSWVTLRPLISAANDRINGFAPQLVTQLRDEWGSRPQRADGGRPVDPDTWTVVEDGTTYRRVVRRPQDNAFLLMGDTGEQDASQYVLVPALRAAAAGDGLPGGERPGFLVVCSDVVYPSGDVQDYVHAVYLPYGPRPPEVAGLDADGDADPLGTLDVLALPGNHDWYDGLTGFSSQFCGREPLPAAAYGWCEGIGVREAAARLVWRRPSRARRARLWRPAAGGTGRPTRREERPAALEEIRRWRVPARRPWRPLQPGSYYAVDTRDVLLVCIDTGIAVHGEPHLDAQQSAWLVDISRHPKPKVLLTGNPLLVNAVWKACTLDTSRLAPSADGRQVPPADVRALVEDPAHRYVATIGGDVHNFQHYEVALDGGRTMTHLVSGGGGAYLSATHPILVAAARRAARTAQGRRPYPGEGRSAALGDGEELLALYPSEEESLQRFGRLLLLKTWRFVRILTALLVGAGGTALVAWLRGRDGVLTAGPGLRGVLATLVDPTTTPAPAVLGRALTGGALAVAALLAVRVFLPPAVTATRAYRGAFLAGSFVAGVALVLAMWWLDPARVVRDATAWTAVTAAGCLLAYLMRRSSWWREPKSADERPTGWVVPAAAAAWAVIAGWAALHRFLVVLVALVVLGAVTAVGWLWRRRTALPGGLRWNSVAAVSAYLTQGAVALAIVSEVVVPDPTAWFPVVVVVGVGLAPVWALVLLAAVVGALRLVLPLVAGPGWRGAYGAAGRPVQWGLGALVVGVPLAALAAVAWADAAPGGGSGTRPAGGPRWYGVGLAALTVVTVTVVAILLVDVVRRVAGRGYKLANLGIFAASGVGYAVVFGGTWVPRATVTAAVVSTLVVLSAVLVNLTFLGTYALLLDSLARHADRPGFEPFSDDEARQILRWRREGDAFKPTDGAVVRRAQIVFPSTDQPQGAVQRKACEIFDSDSPPFAKHFLVLSTDGATLTVTVRPVDGVHDLAPLATIAIGLGPGAPAGQALVTRRS